MINLLIVCNYFLIDITRLLILDETQAQQFAQTTPQLLKDIGQQQAKINYPVSDMMVIIILN